MRHPVAVRQATARPRLAAAQLVMALSGAAALGWQVVWTAQFGAALGHEIVAVLAVLAAFFGGLALGAQALGRRVAASRWPGRWYTGCELVLLLWGLALSFAMPSLAAAGAGLIGAEPSAAWHWGIAFALPFVLLLPASAAMGATLPALECQLRGAHSRLGGLYAANTFGAVAGLLGAVFLSLPQWGLQRTAWACAGLNAACALLAWQLWRGMPVTPDMPDLSKVPANQASPMRPVAALLLVTGTLGIGYEVLAVRVLSQVTENTVYSYALLLAMYLLGTAAGAAAYQRWGIGSKANPPEQLLDRLLKALALAVLLAGIGLHWADLLCALPARWFGPGAASALMGEALAAAAAMWAPTLVMGALFTHLCLQAQAQAWPLGRALALNTAGAALAPAWMGVGLLPLVGANACIALLVLAYLALQARVGWRRPATLALAVAAVTLAVGPAPLRFVDLPEGGRVLSYRDGVMAAVSVVEDADGVARLRINNRAQEGSSASGWTERRLAQLPLLLHPAPQRALFLGLGTGFTAVAAAQEPGLQVDAVELLPEVIAAAEGFARSSRDAPAVNPVRTIAADARRYVQAADVRYDVIVADLFHPARSGAGSLYTVEQFAAVRARLAPGGLFCQWLALHQMDLQTLRSITAAFLQVYPNAVAVLAGNSLDTPVLGLVARPDAAGIDLGAVRTRLARAEGSPRLAAARLEDYYAVVGSVVAGPSALARFAGGTLANTDDRPVVVHRAPWATYAPETRPRDRLLALLAELQPSAQEVLLHPDADDAARLQAYWAARRRYIAFGAGVQPDADPAVMLRRVQAPFTELLRLSPDFRPACEPLLAMALALQRAAPAGPIAGRNPERTARDAADLALAREVLGALDALHARCAPSVGGAHGLQPPTSDPSQP